MAVVKNERVIVGNGEEYKYVPVRDFIVEEVEEVFYTKHPYRLMMKEEDIRAINFKQRFQSPEDGGARHFVENNDFAREIKVDDDNVPLVGRVRESNVALAKDLAQYIKDNRNKKGQLEFLIHFRSLQAHTVGRITNTHFYSDGDELSNLPNYSNSICWGSHRISQNVPQESVHNQFLNMLFNLDLSSPRRGNYGINDLRKLSNVAKLFGYSDEDIRWMELFTLDSSQPFNIFDFLLVASFFGVCVDDYLKSNRN